MDEKFSKKVEIMTKKGKAEMKSLINQIKTQQGASPVEESKQEKEYQGSKIRLRKYYIHQ